MLYKKDKQDVPSQKEEPQSSSSKNKTKTNKQNPQKNPLLSTVMKRNKSNSWGDNDKTKKGTALQDTVKYFWGSVAKKLSELALIFSYYLFSWLC